MNRNKIAIFASLALGALALSGCAAGFGVAANDDGLHVGGGLSTPIGGAGGGITIGGDSLIRAGAGVDTPLAGVHAHMGVGGKSLIGAGAHVDTPVGSAGVKAKVLSNKGLISGGAYADPAD